MPIFPESSPAPVSDLTISQAFLPDRAPRRVLVYAPLAFSTPHFETDLEIAQRHLDLGDQVELVLCDAELPSCQLNPLHETQRCIQCVSRSLQGAAQLARAVPIHGALRALAPDDLARLAGLPRKFADQEALRRYCFDGFDAGLAALSSLIDFARAVTLDTKLHAAVIHRTIYSAVAAFLAFKRLLAASRYDRVYIYNGRWSVMRAAVRACEQLGVPYYTHERGSDFRKFALYRDSLPHEKTAFRDRTKAAWAHAAGHPQTVPLAEAFFLERRQRVEKSWFSHVKQQEAGRTPADWDRAARRLVFFTSSEFEFAAIGGNTVGKIYPDQVGALRRIAQLLATRSPATHLWVRVHPNDKSPATVQRWTEATVSLSNVTLIRPDEKTDSYALLEGADRVLTFGSTIGIEATYWGRPAICGDFSFYDGLDAQYEVANEEELLDLLCRAELPPKPREHALRYGYYLNTFGDPFQHFVTEQISDYEFKSPFRGHCLRPDYDDLRKRLIDLFQKGEFVRSADIARLMADFNPGDDAAHSVLVLGLIRLGATKDAVHALESAAAKLTLPQLELVLKNTASPLLDALMRHANTGEPGDFKTLARRTGSVLLRTPTFMAIGQKLSAMADRAGHTSPVRPQAVH
ncbi:MAG: hypothetical protein HYV95_11900 [Opitutae bacterium]|nr:hypothetical protein [Opitutae bacterium]